MSHAPTKRWLRAVPDPSMPIGVRIPIELIAKSEADDSGTALSDNSPDDNIGPHVFFELISETISISTIGPPRPTDRDLADHVRSLLGTMVKQLDLPRIHVMAEGSRVLLHGDVANVSDAEKIESFVSALDEVDCVESHLHIGLLPSDTRPSETKPETSAMMRALLDAPMAIGIEEGSPSSCAAWGALSAILEQIPPNERRHVIAHFPNDVVLFVKPRRHLGDEGIHWKTELALEAAAAIRGGVTLEDARVIVPLIIAVLRKFVPEEDQDIQATLRAHLKDLWVDAASPLLPPTLGNDDPWH
jgi:BON domain